MGHLGRFFRYKVFVDALFRSEVMSIFNLPIDNRYFTLILRNMRAELLTFKNGILSLDSCSKAIAWFYRKKIVSGTLKSLL